MNKISCLLLDNGSSFCLYHQQEAATSIQFLIYFSIFFHSCTEKLNHDSVYSFQANSSPVPA